MKLVNQAACDLLVSRPRQGFSNHIPGTKLPPWPDRLERTEEVTWGPEFRLSLQRLLVAYPENMISAYSTSLERLRFSPSHPVLIGPLLHAMDNPDSSDNLLHETLLYGDNDDVVAMRKFLESEGSQSVIAELNKAQQQAFEKLHTELDFDSLQSLLRTRLRVARYLKQDVTQEPSYSSR